MSQGVFERWERRTRSCWPVIRQLIFNAALPHSGQRRSVTEHQLLCCGELKTTSHIPRTKIGQMEPHSQNFFQIFFHSSHAALHRASDNTLVHALLPGDLAVALTEDTGGCVSISVWVSVSSWPSSAKAETPPTHKEKHSRTIIPIFFAIDFTSFILVVGVLPPFADIVHLLCWMIIKSMLCQC